MKNIFEIFQRRTNRTIKAIWCTQLKVTVNFGNGQVNENELLYIVLIQTERTINCIQSMTLKSGELKC